MLVTDGQVAGEDVVLESLHATSGQPACRAFTRLGIDRAVNAGFLQKLADLGGGTAIWSSRRSGWTRRWSTFTGPLAMPVLTQIRLEVVCGRMAA